MFEGFMGGMGDAAGGGINGQGGSSGDAFSGSDFTQSNSWGSAFNVGSGSATGGGIPPWVFIVAAVLAAFWIFKRK